jgi:ribonuclease D
MYDLHMNKKIILSNKDFDLSVYMQSDEVAIDTEALGLNLMRDRLCVVQMYFGNDVCYLLQISKHEKYPNFVKMLKSKKICKVFHYGRFDIAAIYSHFNLLTQYPIFCTKIASRIARTYTEKHGLKNLCKELLGVDLNKEQQSSDWGAYELSESQKQYAAQDVLYLFDLKSKLTEMLVRENRMHLAEQCFQFLPTRSLLDCSGWENDDPLSWGTHYHR